ncbi:MAG: glycosyltransferase [Saprospiraceae bacterium]|nr:glycosyltransferase [Saprospiraceae bacterium]
MKLSIVIVNYNVRHFLEQCLNSVSKAITNIQAEIIVVDNASMDDSVEMVLEMFPSVKLVASKENLGFSKANNIGVRQATGQYVLILNPDTLVEEDCLIKCLDFFEKHPETGALGVKMLDGAGHFLPESKRGFPGLWNSFCKMSGLYKLFPKSSLFNAYYLGHLTEDKIQKVDVLSGAFMMMKTELYRQLEGFDEAYFMYGEDIDLSYRIQKAGYINYYFPETTILHFKGESTRKSSLNYLTAFYNAMIIFSFKHITGGQKTFFIVFLKALIWAKALMSAVKSSFIQLRMVLIDGIALCLGFQFIRNVWSEVYHGNSDYLDKLPTLINTALFILIWISSFYYQGVYEKKYTLKDIVIAAIWGFFINLMLYAMLPEEWRASRMLLVFSFFYVIGYAIMSRLFLNKFIKNQWTIGSDQPLNGLVIGDDSQFEKAKVLIQFTRNKIQLMHKNVENTLNFTPEMWVDFIRINNIHEIILCEKNMPWKEILGFIAKFRGKADFKILTSSGSGIVGSSSKDQPGDIYSFELDYHLSQKVFQRQKRLFDVLFACLHLSFIWILIFLYKDKKQYLLNIFKVITNQRSWVSYDRFKKMELNLPPLKEGILQVFQLNSQQYMQEIAIQMVHNYAWNYTVWMDLDICLKEFLKLDQK